MTNSRFQIKRLLKSCLLTEDFKVKYYNWNKCMSFWVFLRLWSPLQLSGIHCKYICDDTVKQSALFAKFHTRSINFKLTSENKFGGSLRQKQKTFALLQVSVAAQWLFKVTKKKKFTVVLTQWQTHTRADCWFSICIGLLQGDGCNFLMLK